MRMVCPNKHNPRLVFTDACLLSFVSSNAKQMPTAVCDALKEGFQSQGGMSSAEADEMLVAMERAGRFQSETWS